MHREYDPRHHEHHNHGARKGSWWALVPWVALIYVATGFYTVETSERAIVQRFGRALPGLRGPGLHFGFPFGIDKVTRIRVFESKRVGVGRSLTERALGRRTQSLQAECVTGDNNLILVSAVVQYHVDPERAHDYLFRAADVPTMVSNAAASALATAVSSRSVDDVLTTARLAIQEEVKAKAQADLDRYGAGVRITAVPLEDVDPPEAVAEAFHDVTAARGDWQRYQDQAVGYAKRLKAQTRGEVAQIRLQAEAEANAVLRRAEARAKGFLSQVEKLAGRREVTMRRLILETMAEVLPRLRKVVLDEDVRKTLGLGLIEGEP